MRTPSYKLSFLSPAFLGDAGQNGTWRTPPIKTLLRQWWRVAVAKDLNYDVNRLRQREAELFGSAADGKGRSGQSKVRIRLDGPSGETGWKATTQGGVAPMRTDLSTSYSWFGLRDRKDRVTKRPLPDRTAIRTDSKANERLLRIAVPDGFAGELETAIRLVHSFGQLGSRARVGWGALHLDGVEPLSASEIGKFSRHYLDALEKDWPHAFGADDDGPWVWESQAKRAKFNDWFSALAWVAGLRKEVRSSLKQSIDLRPLLGFAKEKSRAASPLRWRVFTADQGRSIGIRVFALPHRLPAVAGQDAINRHAVSGWASVVQQLDRSGLERVR